MGSVLYYYQHISTQLTVVALRNQFLIVQQFMREQTQSVALEMMLVSFVKVLKLQNLCVPLHDFIR